MSSYNSTIEQITLELTRRCPNRCLHCSSNSSPDVKELIEIDRVKHIIDEGIALGLREVILSGGEPLIYPDIVSVINYLQVNGIRTIIYTSGSVLTDDGIPQAVSADYVRNLLDLGVDRFNLSFHSDLASVHDHFMGASGSWVRALSFLEDVVKQGGNIHIHSVVTKDNYNRIFNLAIFLNQLGISTLRLMQLVPQGRALLFYKQLQLEEQDWLVVRKQLEEVDSNPALSIRIKLGAHFPASFGQTAYQCSLDKGKLLVDPHGTVAICPALKGISAITGAPNALQTSLKSIIGGEWRVSMANRKKPSIASKCTVEEAYNEKYSTR